MLSWSFKGIVHGYRAGGGGGGGEGGGLKPPPPPRFSGSTLYLLGKIVDL